MPIDGWCITVYQVTLNLSYKLKHFDPTSEEPVSDKILPLEGS